MQHRESEVPMALDASGELNSGPGLASASLTKPKAAPMAKRTLMMGESLGMTGACCGTRSFELQSALQRILYFQASTHVCVYIYMYDSTDKCKYKKCVNLETEREREI